LQAQLTSEKQRYEQLSQQTDADRLAAALALEEARKKFDLDLEEALKTAQLESEKELGVERERMSTVRFSSSSNTCSSFFLPSF
jgi:hypothetical protein